MEAPAFDLFLSDNVVFTPSPQRIRNTLTLEERVQAIQAFDVQPMYSKVAKMFNCCWEQIRNIIANRETIMQCYEAFKTNGNDGHYTPPPLPQIQYSSSKPAPPVPSFKSSPQQTSQFRNNRPQPSHHPQQHHQYNSPQQQHHQQQQQQQNSHHNHHRSLIETNPNRSSADLQEDRMRQRKIDFLSRCLYEYIKRANYHNNVTITFDILRNKANDFGQYIKIPDFVPNKVWIFNFANKYKLSLPCERMSFKKVPSNCLELKKIMAHCSLIAQQNNNNNNRSFNLNSSGARPNLPAQQKAETKPLSSSFAPLIENQDSHRVEEFTKTQSKMVLLEKAVFEYVQRTRVHRKIMPDDDDIKSRAGELRAFLELDDVFTPDESWLEHYKSRYDFNLRNRLAKNVPRSLDLNFILLYVSRHENQNNILATLKLEPAKKRPAPDDNDDKTTSDVKVNNTNSNSNDSSDSAFKPPAIKVKRVESLMEPSFVTRSSSSNQHSPNILKPLSNRSNNENTQHMKAPSQQSKSPPSLKPESPKQQQPPQQQEKPSQENTQPDLRTYADALAYLKPLEEFAMLKDNYRVIGILSQLEKVFKEPNQGEED